MRGARAWAAFAVMTAVLAVTGAASAGGGCHRQTTSDAAGTSVELTGNCFGPTVLRVAEGQTVTWKNADPIEHTVTAAGGVFDSAIAAGESFTFTFAKAGVYPYYCLLHARMAGAVVVGDSSVSEVAASQPLPVSRLGDAPEPGTSATSAALIAALVAAPLSFAAGRILRGRRRET